MFQAHNNLRNLACIIAYVVHCNLVPKRTLRCSWTTDKTSEPQVQNYVLNNMFRSNFWEVQWWKLNGKKNSSDLRV